MLGIGTTRQLGYDVIDVQFAAKAADPQMFANLRASMHGAVREFIRKGGALPFDPRLLDQMATIEYGHTPTGQILLERKDDLRLRLGYSPDELDSLCCTFAVDVAIELDDSAPSAAQSSKAVREYSPYAETNRGFDPFMIAGRR